MTNQVSNQAMTNPNKTTTSQSMANISTNQDASGTPSIMSGCGSDWRPSQMEYQSVTLIMHQELGVMPLWIQWLNYHNVLKEFDSEVDVG